jgi:hypothetical protein
MLQQRNTHHESRVGSFGGALRGLAKKLQGAIEIACGSRRAASEKQSRRVSRLQRQARSRPLERLAVVTPLPGNSCNELMRRGVIRRIIDQRASQRSRVLDTTFAQRGERCVDRLGTPPPVVRRLCVHVRWPPVPDHRDLSQQHIRLCARSEAKPSQAKPSHPSLVIPGRATGSAQSAAR